MGELTKSILEVKQVGKIREPNGNIIIDHYKSNDEFIVIEQFDPEKFKKKIFIRCKNIKKLITILKTIK